MYTYREPTQSRVQQAPGAPVDDKANGIALLFTMLEQRKKAAAKAEGQKKAAEAGNPLSSLSGMMDTGKSAKTKADERIGKKYPRGGGMMSMGESGAELGTKIFPGWGTAIGAVVGSIAGYFLSAEDKDAMREAEKLEERDWEIGRG